jgi:hypothetical protein
VAERADRRGIIRSLNGDGVKWLSKQVVDNPTVNPAKDEN